jgi:uncharacterized protein YjbI with pentapeptide repeats
MLPDARIVPTAWRPHWSSKDHWTSLHAVLFAGSPDEVSGRPRSLFSNRLVLTNQIFVDPDKLDKISVSVSLRGRDLKQAALDRADLRKGDFTGARLDGATLTGANLQDGEFGCAARAARELGCTSLQGVNAVYANLQGANLERAEGQGATLLGASLQGANLDSAQLQGADLSGSDLRVANLRGADLRGANLFSAVLQAAYLEQTDLRGADVRLARLQGAALSRADLRGASLNNSLFWRAWGTPNINLSELGAIDAVTTPWTTFDSNSPFPVGPAGRPPSSFTAWQNEIRRSVPAWRREELVVLLDPDLDDEKLERRMSERVLLYEKGSMLSAEFWRRAITEAPQGEGQRALATFLAELGCASDAAPYVARGLIKRIASSIGGQPTILLDRLRKGRSEPTACPGVKGFTDDDWAGLDQAVAEASKPVPDAK